MDEPEQPGPFPGPNPNPNPAPDSPGPGSFPGPDPDPDPDRDAEFEEWAAWLDREEAAGRDPFPPERPPAQGISISLGDATGLDPALLAAICGPGGLGGEGLGPQFAQDAAADVLAPTPVLAALTEEAVADVSRLSDDQLVGVLQAARRQESREAWKKAVVIAEFTRRRAAEFAAARARGVPVHCRPGQFPGEELTAELVVGPVQAAHAIDDATDLVTRLPRTLAGMAAGLIDADRAGVISLHTRLLSPQDAALADEVLAALAPALRLEQLARKAAKLEMKLNPEAVKARKERARRTRQRVEVRQEGSGNASVSGREMDTTDALASKAHIDALARALRGAGVLGSLDQLRLLVFADLTVGRDPLDRITRPAQAPAEPAGDTVPADPATGDDITADPATAGPATGDDITAGPAAGDETTMPSTAQAPGGDPDETPAGGHGGRGGRGEDGAGPGPGTGGTGPGSLDYDHDSGDYDDYGGGGDPDAPDSPPARPPAPMPAVINLLVPAGTLLGWDTTPAEADAWDLLDADDTKATVAAASQHPATRWCVTFLRPDGTAAAHGCAPGRHPWTPEETQEPEETEETQGPEGQQRKPPGRRAPTPDQAARLTALLRSLNLTPEPVARGDCDHAAAEPRYTPSRRLAHLIRARTATCDAPACGAPATRADLDHTTAYPDGPTDQCNLGPKCRRHHKAKQAPGWKVEQPEPGVIRWTLPSGRVHTTRPTVYDFCT